LWQVPVTAEPEVVFVHLVDASGQVVGRIDQAPFDGRLPVLAWPPGESVRQRLTLDVSPTALPGEGALRVGIYPEGRPDDALRVTRAGEAPAGSYWIRPVRIAEQPP
jgi:hypothetical protein